MMLIRNEIDEDISAVRKVNRLAFGRPDEARLVDQVRANCNQCFSLVGLVNSRVVGHILFSPVVIEGPSGRIKGMGLAPMAVRPDYQRQGIGSRLVIFGLGRLLRRRCPFVTVLGHPRYYPRFGFQPGHRFKVSSEWDCPRDAFMILILDRSKLPRISGTAHYRPEFTAGL